MEWRHETWNPVTGCSPVSEGCSNCYARGIALRLKEMGVEKYSRGFSVAVHEDVLDKPRHWRLPRMVFVTSMGDLMHSDVPDEFVRRVFRVMAECPEHQFQLLTKRPERMALISGTMKWPGNVWAGTTVEDRSVYSRLEHLRRVDARIRFISFEPLLEEVGDVCLEGIHWAAVGGESGPDARPLKAVWVRHIRDRCVAEGIAFYFKQWGGRHHSSGGRILDGRTWDQKPDPVVVTSDAQMELDL